MSFDRGFIKWQPFNSLISNKVVLNNIKKDKIIKPDLFPEKIEQINQKLYEAFYAKDTVHIKFYEAGEFRDIEAYIVRMSLNDKTLLLSNNKIIAFSQIININ